MAEINSNSKLFYESIVYRPFYYPEAVEIDKEHEKMHWVEDEVPLGDDVNQWKGGKITDDEKAFTVNVFKFFTTTDVMVGTFYIDHLIPTVKNNEVRNMLIGFANREKTHQKAYALLNDTLGLPESIYSSFLDYKEMKEKADYALDADPSTIRGLGLALAKDMFSEGISLFASFAMLLNFKRYGKLMGMCKILDWSLLDESKHLEGISWLFRTLVQEHPRIVTDKFKREIYDMCRTIVELEDNFVDLVFANHTIEGLDKDEVKKYIRYIADRRLIQLGLRGNFGVKENPLTWLDWILGASTHSNFFETKVAEYEVAGLQGDSWGYDDEIPKDEQRKFIIYSKDGCPFCVKAKDLLSSNGHEYTEVDLTDDALRNKFYDDNKFEERSVPKIYEVKEDGNEFIGGYTQLRGQFRTF